MTSQNSNKNEVQNPSFVLVTLQRIVQKKLELNPLNNQKEIFYYAEIEESNNKVWLNHSQYQQLLKNRDSKFNEYELNQSKSNFEIIKNQLKKDIETQNNSQIIQNPLLFLKEKCQFDEHDSLFAEKEDSIIAEKEDSIFAEKQDNLQDDENLSKEERNHVLDFLNVQKQQLQENENDSSEQPINSSEKNEIKMKNKLNNDKSLKQNSQEKDSIILINPQFQDQQNQNGNCVLINQIFSRHISIEDSKDECHIQENKNINKQQVEKFNSQISPQLNSNPRQVEEETIQSNINSIQQTKQSQCINIMNNQVNEIKDDIIIMTKQNKEVSKKDTSKMISKQFSNDDISLLSIESIPQFKSESKSQTTNQAIKTNLLLPQQNDTDNLEKHEQSNKQEQSQSNQLNLQSDNNLMNSQKIKIDQSVIITKCIKAENKQIKIQNHKQKIDLITIQSFDKKEDDSLNENQIKKNINSQNQLTQHVNNKIKVHIRDKNIKKQCGHFQTDRAELISNHRVNYKKLENNEDMLQLTIYNVTKFFYKVTWQKRFSGRIPYPSYLSYEEVRLAAPKLLLDYLEKMAYLKKL